MVAHHTALQPKLPISLRWIPGEGDKIEALDPLQASHAVHLLFSADQAAMLLDPDGFDILPFERECLSFSPPLSSHNGRFWPGPFSFPPIALCVTLPAYRSDFPSCASRLQLCKKRAILRIKPAVLILRIKCFAKRTEGRKGQWSSYH